MAEGFLGRWSQRKQAVREGKPVEEPPPAAPEAEAPPMAAVVQGTSVPPQAPAEPVAPPPTLQDVQALTPQSDFQRFVAPDVDPDVKHAAMRKLFSDPHFNVMDGMDVYIDDYNTPNPMPASMLRKMASAHFLGLVEEEKEPAPAGAVQPASEAAPPHEALAAGTDTRTVPDPEEVPHETTHHDHPDLRLQQDHAAGPQGSGRSAG